MSTTYEIPFVNYVFEDKSGYKTASDAGFHDPDGDFLVGESGGFLLNINFKFVDTHLLRAAAIYYEKYKRYTDYPIDSPPHRRFRIQEEYRRNNGFTANCKLLYKDIPLYERLINSGKIKEAKALVKPLRISGEHYNFINYASIRQLDESSVVISKEGKVSAKKKEDIPLFFGSQYWWYKSKEFARNNGYHLIVGKARRGGFSYMEACGSANTVNLNPGSTVIHCAADKKYLTQGRSISNMTLSQLEYYELKTPFLRGFISRDVEDVQLGFKKKDGTNAGYQSHVISVTTGPANPDVAIGKDAIEIKCEELSAFPTFDEFMNVTEPTTRTGSITTGLITAWGTGGSKEAKWEVFEKNFYNPSSYSFMPFENVWDKDSRGLICGFFKPYIESLQGYNKEGEASLDKDGNTNYRVAIQISNEEREAYKAKTTSILKYILYCGQYANMPSESFSSTTDNIFASPELSIHINNVRHNPDYKFYVDGVIVDTPSGLKFESNISLFNKGLKTHPYIEDVPPKSGVDKIGCIRMFMPPYKDPKTGKVPDIYTISYDPIGRAREDEKDQLVSRKSFNSATVWMNPNDYFPQVTKLRIANYFGRPNTLEEADAVVRDLSLLYGEASILAEIDRGETRSNFKKWGLMRLLAKEPTVVWDNKVKATASTNYGIVLGNDIRKAQGLRLLYELLYTTIGADADGNPIYVFHKCGDLSFLLELQKWNNIGNFDRVSDAIIEAFTTKKQNILAAIKIKTRKKVEESILTRAWY